MSSNTSKTKYSRLDDEDNDSGKIKPVTTKTKGGYTQVAGDEDPEAQELDQAPPQGVLERIRNIFNSVQNPYLIFLLLFLIFIGTVNRVTSKIQTVYTYNYPYMLSQLTTIVYIPIFYGIVWYKLARGTSITEDMTSFPKRKFAVMGTLDALAGFLMIFGLDHISGPMSVLLIQGAIPVTMIATVLILRMRYHRLQYAGAFIILIGIFISLYPSLAGHAAGAGSAATLLFWNMVFFSNNVPTALSSVYKEIAFKAQAMDVMYLNAWVALFQFLVGLLLAPVAAPLQNMPLAEIPTNLLNGSKCIFLGINTITECPPNVEGCRVDDCGPALLAVSAYIAANILYNIALLLVLKHGSAALMFIASTVIIPLANITFTFKFVMGDQATTLSGYDIGGLLVILTGLILYRSVSETSADAEAEEDGQDPIFTMGLTGNLETAVRVIRSKKVAIKPRTTTTIRNSYISRLGIKAPPPNSPSVSDEGSINATSSSSLLAGKPGSKASRSQPKSIGGGGNNANYGSTDRAPSVPSSGILSTSTPKGTV